MNFNAEQFKNRFWINMKKDGPMNIPGYGPSRPWVPPIQTPKSILTIYDRFWITTMNQYSPLIVGFFSWLANTGSGDSWDGYWYNNAVAAGSQLYPTGLSKYFDIHSTGGLFDYMWKWIWDFIQQMLLPLTFFLPIDFWLNMFSASWDGVWKIFVFYMPFTIFSGFGIFPSIVASYFGIEMEDGWGILMN